MSATGDASANAGGPRRRLSRVWLIGIAIAVVLIAANAHLVYVAFTSQPDCVSHLKLPDGSADHFRAARSGC